ncbi:DoxX family protein [Mycobacterium eburneum]|nr:DoxX family protein [Mycobacterium eburneum]TDH56247.1 DoxX family protein [Mycobacterium eburneum]
MATRIGFRFGFCYFGLFGLACVLGLIPILLAGLGIHLPWASVSALVGVLRAPSEWMAAVVGLRIDSMQLGSDSAFQWTALFAMVLLAGLATLVWSVLDRRRGAYPRLSAWFALYLRFVLATAMFYFGMAKVIPTQMPFVLNRLVEPYGNFSPEGVLWSQVSVSQPYEIALGAAELLGGLLLVVPRTAAAGALLCAIDMTQVFLLNMTYDIRLKSVSSMLLLVSLFLLAPHLRRLLTVLCSDRAVPAARTGPSFTTRRAVAVQLLVGVALLGMTAAQNWHQWRRPIPELYGIYRVDGFSAEGYRRDPLLTDELRWHRVVFDRPFHVSDPVVLTIQHMDASFEEYGGTIDPRRHFIDLEHRIELGTFKETPVRVRLTYWWPGPNRLVIDADDYAGHRIHAWCTKLDADSFPLVERGFSWVQEQPYNR